MSTKGRGQIRTYSDAKGGTYNTFGRFRGFVVTDFNLDIERYQKISELKSIEYMICNHETCPKTMKEHLQCFIYFDTPFQYMSVLNKLKYEKDHEDCYPFMEPSRGSILKNVKYCTKLGDIPDKPNKVVFEKGVRPIVDEKGKRNDLLECYEYIKKGNTDYREKFPYMYLKYGAKLDALYSETLPKRNWEMEVYYIYGPTSTGKSHEVFGGKYDLKDIYVHDHTCEYFNKYIGQPIMVIDEFKSNCPRNKITIRMLNQLCDKYPMTVPIKGGSMEFTSKKIYIISNYNPYDEFYPNEPAYIKDTFYRRLTDIIHLTKRVGNNSGRQLNSTIIKSFVNRKDQNKKAISEFFKPSEIDDSKGEFVIELDEDIDIDSDDSF